jgi:ATP-dependent Lon protease
VTGLSWRKEEASRIDLERAREILDEDHYGLKKVKDRIIQQIAVMKLKKQQSGSILLFVGALGTGKTSIGKSIARALASLLTGKVVDHHIAMTGEVSLRGAVTAIGGFRKSLWPRSARASQKCLSQRAMKQT